MKLVIIGRNQTGQRLDKFLHKYLPLAGNGFLYKMLRKKNITLNGRKAEGNEILALNDEVRIFFSDETFAKFSGAAEQGACCGNYHEDYSEMAGEYEAAYEKVQGIEVLYEDEDCLILDKPVGVLSQKAKAGDCSLNEWMIGYLLAQNSLLEEELATFRPSVCNRLDRNTSGIVLCGKSLAGLQYLSRCLKERKVRKFYRTICLGELSESVEAQGYLVKDAARNRVTVSRMPSGKDKSKESKICTIYSPIVWRNGYTLLEVELVTGKSHQIRAHLAGMGYPLIGDFKYGNEAANREIKRKYGLEHQLLHCYRVEFSESDPAALLKGRSFCSPCPNEFAGLQSQLHLEESITLI